MRFQTNAMLSLLVLTLGAPRTFAQSGHPSSVNPTVGALRETVVAMQSSVNAQLLYHEPTLTDWTAVSALTVAFPLADHSARVLLSHWLSTPRVSLGLRGACVALHLLSMPCPHVVCGRFCR